MGKRAKHTKRVSMLSAALLGGLSLCLPACGQEEAADADGGTGGETGSGSTTASGGGPVTATGGVTGSGGGAPTGGVASADGGAESSGGQAASGGSSATSACDGTVGPTGVQELSLEVGGQERTFVLSVPESHEASQPLALVFAWHGLGGSGSLARLYFGVEGQAGDAAIFVYPDGLPVADQDDQPGWDLAPDGIDVAFFDALLAALSSDYCVDSERVFSIGHSYGGYMTNRLGCSRTDVLRGVAPVAGGPPFGGGASPCSGPMAAFVTHGTLDPVVDLDQGTLARDDYLSRSECDGTSAPSEPSPCVAYDGCQSESPVVWCEHDAEEADAHDWPSFAASGIWGFLSSLP